MSQALSPQKQHEMNVKLCDAFRRRDLRTFKLALEQGASPNTVYLGRAYDGETKDPILCVVATETPYAVALLQAGANVKLSDAENHSALYAARANNAVTDLLLLCGARPNDWDKAAFARMEQEPRVLQILGGEQKMPTEREFDVMYPRYEFNMAKRNQSPHLNGQMDEPPAQSQQQSQTGHTATVTKKPNYTQQVKPKQRPSSQQEHKKPIDKGVKPEDATGALGEIVYYPRRDDDGGRNR